MTMLCYTGAKKGAFPKKFATMEGGFRLPGQGPHLLDGGCIPEERLEQIERDMLMEIIENKFNISEGPRFVLIAKGNILASYFSNKQVVWHCFFIARMKSRVRRLRF